MPKIITRDMIDRIAEYAAKDYSKAATARELDLDRTTVRKYWPSEQEAEEEEGKQPTLHVSLEEEFNLLSKKTETDHGLESLLNKIKGWKWETESLKGRGKAAVTGIEFLREKLANVGSVEEVDNVRELAAKVKDNVTALLDENESLRRQHRQEEGKKAESLMEARLNELAWLFPCRRDQARKIVERLVFSDDDQVGALHDVGFLTSIADDLEWEENADPLKPLLTECANLLKGNWDETERIMCIEYERKKQILVPGDEDMEKKYLHMLDLLTVEVNEHSVEMVFKFNAALGRLAEERYLDKGEFLAEETAHRQGFGLAKPVTRSAKR